MRFIVSLGDVRDRDGNLVAPVQHVDYGDWLDGSEKPEPISDQEEREHGDHDR